MPTARKSTKKVPKVKVEVPKPNESLYQLGLDCRRMVQIKEQIDELEKEKKELDRYIKKAITARGEAVLIDDPERAGVKYMVKIIEVVTSRLDTALVKRVLDDEQIELCSKESKSERMTIEEMNTEREAIL